MSVEQDAGTTESAIASDATRQYPIDKARGNRSVLTMPLAKTAGMKTQTVVRVDAMIEPLICLAP